MKVSLNPSLSTIIIFILICSDLSYGIAQDMIKLNTGQELRVKIHDKNGRTLSYFLEDEDSCKLHVLSRNSVKWFRYEFLTRKRVSFSFSFGGIPYGTASSIKNYMKDRGYESTVPGWFGSTEYPISHVKMPVLLEVEYLLKPPHGISVEFAASNSGSVQGYNENSYDYTPEVYFSNPQLSLSYKLYAKGYKSALQAGLILDFSTIKDVDPYSSSDEISDSQVSYGFLIGYTGSLFEKEFFFMRFQTQLRYVIPIKCKEPELFMYEEKIGLSQYFIGIQMGAKLYAANRKR